MTSQTSQGSCEVCLLLKCQCYRSMQATLPKGRITSQMKKPFSMSEIVPPASLNVLNIPREHHFPPLRSVKNASRPNSAPSHLIKTQPLPQPSPPAKPAKVGMPKSARDKGYPQKHGGVTPRVSSYTPRWGVKLPSRMVITEVQQAHASCILCCRDMRKGCHALFCGICFNYYCFTCGPEPADDPCPCPQKVEQDKVDWGEESWVKLKLVASCSGLVSNLQADLHLVLKTRSALAKTISQEIARALDEHRVQEENVIVHGIQVIDGTMAVAEVRIRVLEPSSSVQGVRRDLKTALKDPSSTLRKGALCDGSPPILSLNAKECKVEITWPVARIRRVLSEKFPIDVDKIALENLVNAVEASSRGYHKVQKTLDDVEPVEIARLRAFESMSSFEGQLKNEREAKEGNLPADWAMQEIPSNDLPQLLRHATVAQQLLKEMVAPGTAWAATAMNNPEKHSLSDPQRKLACGSHLSRGGLAFDPGIKSESRVEEKAKSRKRQVHGPPPYYQLVDVSRLSITYDTAYDLMEGIQNWLETGQLCWLDNKFHHPSSVGYADINIGVQFTIHEEFGEYKHVSEVQLQLAPFMTFKMGKGHDHYETIRSEIAKSGAKGLDVEAIQRVILRELDHTAGWEGLGLMIQRLAHDHEVLLERLDMEAHARHAIANNLAQQAEQAAKNKKVEAQHKEDKDKRRQSGKDYLKRVFKRKSTIKTNSP